MLTRLPEMLADLNKRPNASEGFSAKTMFTVGMEYGLTCKEILDNLLGKHRSISRGKYPATASKDLLKAAATAVPTKVGRPAGSTKKKVASLPKPASRKKVKKAEVKAEPEAESMSPEAKETRKKLIAEIAKRNRAVEEIASDVDATPTDDHVVVEELERLMKTSTVNPLSV
jgi:hypothetical protein